MVAALILLGEGLRLAIDEIFRYVCCTSTFSTLHCPHASAVLSSSS